MTHRLLIAAICCAPLAFPQRTAKFEDRDAIAIENDKLELLMLTTGGAFASLTLKDDASKTNPMWNPVKLARDAGAEGRFGASLGHFVCVDGFGPTSKEEAAAGFQGHGEAHRLPWEKLSGSANSAAFKVTLPIVQEVFERKVTLNPGEQVVAVESTLTSLLGFDRPINWAEHGTIGAPFLSPEVTVVDASVGRCETRPRESPRDIHRLASAKEFHYPEAPGAKGGLLNLRTVPASPNSMDHTGCAFDPARQHVFVTALRKDTGLLLGYLLRREEYPWLQEWMNYPSNGMLSRGLEFGTQPYDQPRRVMVDLGKMFGVPAFRWLPAKSAIGTKFLMFYTKVPAGFEQVSDVRLEGGQIIVEDKKGNKRVALKTSHAL